MCPRKFEVRVDKNEKENFINAGTKFYHCQDLRWDEKERRVVFDHNDVVKKDYQNPGYRPAPMSNSQNSKVAYWRDASKRVVDLSEDAFLQDHSRVMEFLRFDCLQYGDPIFVQTHLLDKFIDEVLPILQKKYDIFLDVCEKGNQEFKKKLGRSDVDTFIPLTPQEESRALPVGCGEKRKNDLYHENFPAFVLITHN